MRRNDSTEKCRVLFNFFEHIKIDGARTIGDVPPRHINSHGLWSRRGTHCGRCGEN